MALTRRIVEAVQFCKPTNDQQDPQTGLPPNPKGFFANERTFLSWLQMCLILGAMAVGLLNFGDRIAQMAGMMFAAISIGFMFYALYQFNVRADRLRQKERGNFFEDSTGLIVMVAVVFVAVGMNFALQFAFKLVK